MPLNAREFIDKRGKSNEEFMEHLMPQLDYLEKLMRTVIKSLNAKPNKDKRLIGQYKSMASAIHTVAHSHESKLNTESSLNQALQVMGQLPDFLEADGAANLKLIEEAAKNHPDLKNDVHKNDQYKSVLENIRDINSFCDLGYGQKLGRRMNREMREEFEAKILNDSTVPFRDDVGKQVTYLSNLFTAAAEEMEDQAFKNEYRIAQFRLMADALRVISNRGRFPQDEGVLESRLGTVRTDLSRLLADNDGINLIMLRSVARRHPELLELLSFEGNLKKKKGSHTLSDHIEDVFNYFNIHIDDTLKFTLDGERKDEQKEVQINSDRKAENERLRLQEERDKEEAALVKSIQEEEEQERLEDEAERKAALDEKNREKKQISDALKAQEKIRKEQGSFVLPETVDNRMAAGMFVESAKQRGNQYNALVRFKKRLGETITKWDEYTATEYSKRMAEAEKNMPSENPSEEQMFSAVIEALNDITPEDREQQLRTYYPNFDEVLVAEKARYPEGGNDDEIMRNLYERAMTEQLRVEQRRLEYGPEQIEKARRDATLELAKAKLDSAGQEIKDQYEKEKQARIADTIARQVKETILKAYGVDPYFSNFMSARFPNENLKLQFVRNNMYKNPAFRTAKGEERDRLIFETMMGEFVDDALLSEKSWDEFNRNFARSLNSVPPVLRDPEKKLGPLNIALNLARQAPIEELTEQALLSEIAQDIPPEEIDALAEEKLPLKLSNNELLYKWARERKSEKLKEEVRQERDRQFPEVANAGIQNLKDAYKAADELSQICVDTIVGFEEPEPLKLDYEAEVDRDKSLNQQQKRTLKSQYKKSLEEAKNKKDRELHPRLTTDNDEKLRAEISRDAFLRSQMSPEELHADRLKTLKANREEDKKRRMFQKDWKKRANALDKKNAERLDDVMNERVKDKMIKAGDAVGILCDKLHGLDLGKGDLGKALGNLDDAFTKGNFIEGRKLCTKLNVEPEKKRAKPAPVKAEEQKQEEKPEVKTELKKKEYNKGVVINKKAKVRQKPYVFEPEYAIEKFNKALAEQKKKEDEDRTKAFEARKQIYKNNIAQLWTNIKTDPDMTLEMKKRNMAMILATDRMLSDAEKKEDLNDETVTQKTEEILVGSPLRLTLRKGQPDYTLDPNPNNFINAFDKQVKYVRGYTVPAEQQAKFASRLDPVVSTMEGTRSGKIMVLIPRGSWMNSSDYDAALAAIKNTKENAGHLTTEQVYRNCITVLKYIDGKEAVRKREFGRKRWTQCMTFLKQTMPPDLFRKYCKTINQARHIQDNPLHPDFVSPESFGSTVHSEALSEAMDQFTRSGDVGTKEEYAAILALKKLNPDEPVNRALLAQKKQEILNDENFRKLTDKAHINELHKLVVIDKGTDYKALADQIQAPKNGNQAVEHQGENEININANPNS